MLNMLKLLPSFLITPVLYIASYLSLVLDIDFPMLGLKGRSHGIAVITNVGSLGLTSGFAPPTPALHAICYACIGKTERKPLVIDEEIVIQDVMPVTYTADHRLVDGAMVRSYVQLMKDYIEQPELMEGLKFKDNKLIKAD